MAAPRRSDSLHSPDLGTPRVFPGGVITPTQSQSSLYGSKKDRYPTQQQSYVSSQAPGPASNSQREREREKRRESMSLSNGGNNQRPVSYVHPTPHSRPLSTVSSIYDPAVLSPNQATPRQGRSLLSSLSMRRRTPSPPSFVPSPLGNHSTPSVPDSLWFASDFMIGAGVVIIQPETEKIVLVSDKREILDHKGKLVEWERFFLPKGRKDVGESIEQAALREGYEEVCFVYKHTIVRANKRITERIQMYIPPTQHPHARPCTPIRTSEPPKLTLPKHRTDLHLNTTPTSS